MLIMAADAEDCKTGDGRGCAGRLGEGETFRTAAASAEVVAVAARSTSGIGGSICGGTGGWTAPHIIVSMPPGAELPG